MNALRENQINLTQEIANTTQKQHRKDYTIYYNSNIATKHLRILHNTTQHNTTQHNTTQHNTTCTNKR
jgi:hypothetical protein